MAMTAKEFFGQCRRIDARIQALVDEQERTRTLGCRVSASYSELPNRTGMTSKVERGALRLFELEQEINAQIDELVEHKKHAQAIITQISDDRYRDILTWRYFDMWTWDQIAKALCYDRVTIWRLHGRALVAADAIMAEGKVATHSYTRT